MKSVCGEIEIPADKSVSHRAVIFSLLAKGKSVIKNFSKAQDPLSSLSVCKNLGLDAEFDNDNLIINSNGVLKKPDCVLDCGNSGTTMRLMSGILAGQNFSSILTGDGSLSLRPMKRIIEPLELMGAKIISDNFHAPLNIQGGDLHGITYDSKIASAQVKSCVLLAGLSAEGRTVYSEPVLSRNHTEIMLKSMGANIQIDNNTVSVSKSVLSPINTTIFGDISSAAFFIAAALIVPKSKIIIKNIGLNPTRTGILKILDKMNANIEILDEKEVFGEVVGDIKVEYSPDLGACEISGEIIPSLIDEIPIIALIATQAHGTTVIKDAQDLRNKESDRIKSTVSELKKLGANIEETQDGMIINGKTILNGGIQVNSYNDHRIAMMLYIADLISKKTIYINNSECISISFPNFNNILNGVVKEF